MLSFFRKKLSDDMSSAATSNSSLSVHNQNENTLDLAALGYRTTDDLRETIYGMYSQR